MDNALSIMKFRQRNKSLQLQYGKVGKWNDSGDWRSIPKAF